jgi:hypothetical protein
VLFQRSANRVHPDTAAEAVHEIAIHLIDLVGADLGEAFVERLRPEAGRRIALVMPVFFEAFCERKSAIPVERVDGR